MRKSLSLAVVCLALAIAANAQRQASLKDAYQECFRVGAAVNPAEVAGKAQTEDAIIKAQFNTITPENVLKWEVVHPKPDQYDFSGGDQYVEFGQQNHMFIIGHVLVWHSQTPKWVFEDEKGNPVSREVLLQRMHDHISKVVGRYKGKINGWDVVNEAVADDGTMRQSPWMKIIGEDYIEKAFQFAHEADPQAELYYNDYSVENTAQKLNLTLELVKKLKAKGAPITGVGLQDHVSLDSPTAEQVDTAIGEIGKLGLKVVITELDVDLLPWPGTNFTADVAMHAAADPKLNPYPKGLPDGVQQALTKRYADLFGAYAKHCGVVTRVTFWGVTDKDSWKNDWPIKGRSNYPLMFDREGKPKPAVDAVIKVAPRPAP